jgi:probable F420-dependent oxidoreductase
MVTFALQALPLDADSWADLAWQAERIGFASLYVADHPGACASPFVALAAAAAVTTRLRLGSYVLNAGVREPLLIAGDVATLDVVSAGRAILGIGAGHTPAEWEGVGKMRPGVQARIDHCITVASATRQLLDKDLTAPRPVQERLPLLIGGGNTRLLQWAALNADLVGLTGLGRTLPDGHMHEVRWSGDAIDEQIAIVAGRPVEALVQHMEITDDAGAVFASRFPDENQADLAVAPYVLVGTLQEITTKLYEIERRWGITRFAVRKQAIPAVKQFLG